MDIIIWEFKTRKSIVIFFLLLKIEFVFTSFNFTTKKLL